MTNALEKKFFETFGIESDITSCYHRCKKDLNCKECNEAKVIYPQITDHILLELLVIMTRHTDIIDGFDSVQELKEFVLKDLIYSLTQPECNIVKQQVRTLFKEVRNDKI